MVTVKLQFNENCFNCGCENVNIWGTIISGTLRMDVRCMRCGARLYEIPKSVPLKPLKVIAASIEDEK